MGTQPTIDNIIHSQGSFSHILYNSYIVTHAITRSIAFELFLGRTISSDNFEKKIVGGGSKLPKACCSGGTQVEQS